MPDISNILKNLQINDNDCIVISSLNNLSVKLRDSENRKSNEIYNYVKVMLNINNTGKCEICQKSSKIQFDFLKVLVNFVAYNDRNRLMISEKLNNFIELINDELLEERFLILLDNLMVDNDDKEENNQILINIYSNMNSNNLLTKFYDIIVYKLNSCSLDNENNVEKINSLIGFFRKFYLFVISNNRNDINLKMIQLNEFKKLITIISFIEENKCKYQEDDEYLEIMNNYGFFLNIESENLNIVTGNNNNNDNTIIKNLFNIFPKDIDDKQISRLFFGSIGNVSSNSQCNNHQDIQFCLDMITGGGRSQYLISLTFLILGNSIGSSNDRDLLLSKQPNLIDLICGKIEEFNVDSYFQRIVMRKQICEEVNFITEPILQQSIFQLLKLIFTSNEMKNKSVLEVVESDLQKHFDTLVKLMLINFNSVFYIRINLQIILKLLNNLTRNFINYNNKVANLANLKWFILGSKDLIYSLFKSVKIDISTGEHTIVEIGELNEASRSLIFEFFQNLLNVWINLNLSSTFNEEIFKLLINAVLKNGVDRTKIEENNKNNIDNQDISITNLDGSSNNNNDKIEKNLKHINSAMALLLSNKLITLTLLISNAEKYPLNEYLIQDIINDCIEKSFSVIKNDQNSTDASETNGPEITMITNNLKVFLVTFINKNLTSSEDQTNFEKYKAYLSMLK